MCEQGVQERAEHAALRGTGVEGQGGECGAAYQDIQDPVTQGGVEPKVSQLDDELGGNSEL